MSGSYFLLKAVEAPWGDYGNMLFHGMSTHAKRLDGCICLERTGPDIYPVTFPFEIIVIKEFRAFFLESGLTGVTFRPVIKKRIVDLDWSDWDTSDDEPPEIPETGEPEDYILSRAHSPSAAAEMPDLYELCLTEDPSADLFHLPGTVVHAGSANARDWFQRHYGDYVTLTAAG